MGQYSIKDLEMLSGVKAHTLRIWEQRYTFLKPERTDTNIRYYSDEQLKTILNISLLNRHGLRISKIADMSNIELSNEVLKVAQNNTKPDVLLDAMIHSMIDFDEARFEKTLSTAIMRLGFEKTFTELIFPFMYRTGVLWSTGAICPSQEHFISNLIRRKINVAIDNQFVAKNENSKKFVLFLPEGETHELLMLFTEYLLRQHNHEVANIGVSLPYDDIDFLNRAFNPDFFVSFFTVALKDCTLQQYIDKLASSYPDKKIVIGGMQVGLQNPKLPSNVHYITTVVDLLSLIK